MPGPSRDQRCTGRLSRALACALFLGICVPEATGMKGRVELNTRDRACRGPYCLLQFADGFCFDGEGSAQITMNGAHDEAYDSSSLAVLMCTAAEYGSLARKHGAGVACLKHNHEVCENTFPVNWTHAGAFADSVKRENLKGVYNFVLRWCPSDASDSASVVLDYTFLNTHDNHLSCENTHFPQLYLTSAGIWVVVLVAWLLAWGARPQYTVALHKVLSLVPLAQVVSSLLEHQAWQHVFDTGTRSPWLQLCVYIMDAVNMALFWATLMLLAQGDQMGNPAPLNVSERRTAYMSVCWLLCASLANSLLAGFLFLILTVVVMLNVRLVFIWIAQSHELLLMQLAALQQGGPGEREAECLRLSMLVKLNVMFRRTMIAYIMLVILVLVAETFVTEKHYTESTVIYAALRELVDGLLVVVVGVIFRPQRAPVASRVVPMTVAAAGGEGEGGVAGVGEATVGGDGADVAGEGRAAARTPACMPVMVVLPGTTRACGAWPPARGRGPTDGWGDKAPAQVLTYEQLLERVAVGFSLAGGAAPPPPPPPNPATVPEARPPAPEHVHGAVESLDGRTGSGGWVQRVMESTEEEDAAHVLRLERLQAEEERGRGQGDSPRLPAGARVPAALGASVACLSLPGQTEDEQAGRQSETAPLGSAVSARRWQGGARGALADGGDGDGDAGLSALHTDGALALVVSAGVPLAAVVQPVVCVKGGSPGEREDGAGAVLVEDERGVGEMRTFVIPSPGGAGST